MFVLLAAAEQTAASTGPDNLWTFLGIVAVALLGSGGVLVRGRRARRVQEVTPARVAEAVSSDLTSYVQERVRQLEATVERQAGQITQLTADKAVLQSQLTTVQAQQQAQQFYGPRPMPRRHDDDDT